MSLIVKVLSDQRVKAALVFIIGLIAEHIIGIINAVGSASP